tara:strand:+ start:826 stop:1389 length:564 start_codon:yes stop_codon:yes gene_type:complete
MQEFTYKASLNNKNIKESIMNNKKTILHFTLAVGLIVGICVTAKLRPTTATESNYQSNLIQDIKIKDDLMPVEDSAGINEIRIDNVLDSIDINKSAKNRKNTNADTDGAYPAKTIADIRINFDVSSSEAVKEVQKILGLEQDGIFGPKTSAAYQAAIHGETASDSYAKGKSKEKEERAASMTNAMLD